MKKKLYAVSFLLQQSPYELQAVPIQSDRDWDGECKKGFYIGVYPVYAQGYALAKRGESWYLRGPKGECLFRDAPHPCRLFDEWDYLQWQGQYYLAPYRTQKKLLSMGFTEEQLECAIEEIDVPLSYKLECSEQEMEELLQLLEKNGKQSSNLYRKVKANQGSVPFPIYKSFAEGSNT